MNNSWNITKCTVCKKPAISFAGYKNGTHYRHEATHDTRFHWSKGGSSSAYVPSGELLDGSRLHVVEGQTDAEAFAAIGLPVVGVLGSSRLGKALDEVGIDRVRGFAEVIVWRERGAGGDTFIAQARDAARLHGLTIRQADWPIEVADARELLAVTSAAYRVTLSTDNYSGALSHLKLCALMRTGDTRVSGLRAAMLGRVTDITRDATYLGAASTDLVDAPTGEVVSRVEVPPMYRVGERMGVERDGGKKGFTRVIPTPLLIEAIEIDAHDGSERLSLHWRARGNDKHTSVPRDVVASARKITELATKGLPVTSENARGVVKWLHELEVFSPPPLATVARRAGWAGDRHYHDMRDMSVDEGTGTARLLSALDTRGEEDEQVDFLRRVVENHPMAACMCAASLAAALLEPMRARGFALHLWGDSRGGKALDLDTPLPTPDGWTTMGEVRTGDMLIDDNGQPCRVVHAHDVLHGRDCYEVEFSDGEMIIADGDHLWRTSSHRERIAAVRTTVEIMSDMGAAGRRHSVDVARPLDLPHASLPIDPYILGVWLGGGTSASGAITTADAEIVQSLRDAGYEPVKKADKYGWGTRGLYRQLRLLGLLKSKHIPASYLRASADQRLALLQGIVDSDGYIDARGQIEIGLTHIELMNGVHELVCSLGIKCRVRESRATIDGRDCGPVWRMKFLTELPAARLPRKLDRQKREGFKGSHGRRYIVAIRPVESRPVRCVTVDSPSRLYLAGRAMIPTHNTAALKVALSLWGDPIKLMGSWSATHAAIEAQSATLCDLPTALDELQAARSIDHVAQVIYTLANGVGRARATITGDLGMQRQWRTVVLTTGEMPLLPEDSHDGARTRTIDIQARPFTGETAPTDAAMAHDVSERSYGWIGRAMMSDPIMSIANRRFLRDEIGESTSALRDAMGDRVVSVPPIKLLSAGVMTWALQWLGKYVGATNAKPAAHVVAAMMSVATDQASAEDSHGSSIWKASMAILDLIAERPDAFSPHGVTREVLGYIPARQSGEAATDTSTAYFTIKGMRMVCERAGVPYAKARAELHAAGVLSSSQAAVRRGVFPQPTRCFTIDLDAAERVER